MAVKFDLKHLLTTLSCPVELDPLTQAVTFLCGHKMNQSAAEKYYGILEKGSCKLQGRTCVLCKAVVTTYFPDPIVRKLASLFVNHHENFESLPNHPVLLETPKEKPPYPGKPGQFFLLENQWEKPPEGMPLRSIAMGSANDSVLRNFLLFGYPGGRIKLDITFSRNENFQEYLLAHKLPCEQNRTTYSTEALDQIRVLFRIISQNNTVDKNLLPQLSEIVEKGCCEPLPGYDSAPLPLEEPPPIAASNEETIFTLLTCPIKKTPLTDAVNLFPCCHKISKVAAEKLQKCTVCDKPVFDYTSDFFTREIAAHIQNHELQLKKILSQPQHPDFSAIFVFSGGNWETPYKGYSITWPLTRTLTFHSVTKGSFLTEFSLLGYWNGKVILQLYASWLQFKSFYSLIRSLGIQMAADDHPYMYMTNTHDEMKKLFRFIALNCEIPPEYFYKIRSIIERGSCNALPQPVGTPDKIYG